MAKKRGISRRFYVIIAIVFFSAFFIYVYLAVPGNKQVSWNLINLFDKAEKKNFDFNDSIDSMLPEKGFSFDPEYLQRKLAYLFSNNVTIIRQKGNNPVNLVPAAGAAGFRLILKGKIPFGKEFTFNIKQTEEKGGYRIIIRSEMQNLIIRVLKMDKGIENVIDEFPYAYLSKNRKNSVLLMAFFRDYLVIFDGEEVLFQMKNHSLNTAGRMSFFERDRATIKTNYLLKFARMDEKIENDIVRGYEKRFAFLREHKLDYREQVWLPAGYRQFFSSQPPKNKYIQRIKRTDESRQAIYFRVDSSLKYDIKIPRNGSLEFALAAVPKYLIEPERVVFKAVITSSNGSRTKKIEINLGKYKSIHSRFEEFKYDLSTFGGQKCSLNFELNTIDGKPTQEEKKILVAWGSPTIYPVKKIDELNVILVSLDTLQADHLGCYGYNRDTSPNIDKFATNNVMFLNAASCSNWTLPSHLSMLTGLYPTEAGVLQPGFTGNNFIAENAVTIAEYMREAGYKTAGFHGGRYVSDFFGFDKGFDLYRIAGEKDVATGVDETLSWITRNSKYKFFVFFHTYEIHAPYTHDYFLKNSDKNSLSDNEKRIAAYDSDIRYTDIQIGRLIDGLKKAGLYDRTILILTSDHGENFDFVNQALNSGMHGRTLYESEVRIPLIIGGAKFFGESKKINSQVSSADILPTLCGIIDIPLKRDIRGIDLQKMIKKDDYASRVVYMNAPQLSYEMRGLRSSGYKLIKTAYTVKDSGKKKTNTKWEFYNLEKDSSEKNNIWNFQNAMMKSYSKLLLQITSDIKKKTASLRANKPVDDIENKQLREELKALGYLGN